MIPRLGLGSSSRTRTRTRFLPLVLLLALVSTGCPRATHAPDPFPPDGFHDAWQRSDDLRVFTGPELYGHIDGGAEVFLELGFDRLEVQRYGSTSGEVAVELYHMRDPAAALGVYLLKCGREERRPEIPARHTFNPYQVQLVAGGVYASVQRLGGEPPAEDLVAFAREVATRLPAAAVVAELDLLPGEGRVEGSERIIRGPFTLQEVMTLGEGDVLQLGGSTTAVAADYGLASGETSTRLAARYPDPEAASAALASLRDGRDPYLEVVADEPGRLVFKDHAGQFIVATASGDRLEVESGLPEPPS